MKKEFIILLISIFVISACEKREKIPGIVGNPLHLATIIESPEDTAGCKIEWSFLDMPSESNMDILSFQPDSRSFNIYFIPDTPGEYSIHYSIFDAEGKEKDKRDFICEVIEDTTKTEESTEIEQITLKESEIEPPLVYQEPTYPKKYTAEKIAKPKKAIIRRGKNIPKIHGKYTIQTSSWTTLENAERALTAFKSFGLDAYIQKAYFEETNETWYRVRTGSFNTYKEAIITKKELKKLLPREQVWIDNVREDQ